MVKFMNAFSSLPDGNWFHVSWRRHIKQMVEYRLEVDHRLTDGQCRHQFAQLIGNVHHLIMTLRKGVADPFGPISDLLIE